MNPSYIKFSLIKTINSMQRDPEAYVKNAGRDFSRKRKISFSDLILSIISMENHSLNRELRRFFPSDKLRIPTKSAFIQQRKKLNDNALPYIFSSLNSTFPFKKNSMAFIFWHVMVLMSTSLPNSDFSNICRNLRFWCLTDHGTENVSFRMKTIKDALIGRASARLLQVSENETCKRNSGCADSNKNRRGFRPTLLSVGILIRKTELQSVLEGGAIMSSMILIAQANVPPSECDADHATKWYGAAPARVAKQQEGAIPTERGENEYESICYRCSYSYTAGKE